MPNAKPEYFSGSMPTVAQHVRDAPWPAAGDLRATPSREAHVDLDADGSVNGKYDGRKRTCRSSRSKKRAQELREHALQVGEADVLVDPQALDLVEHRRVRRVVVDAVDAARRR